MVWFIYWTQNNCSDVYWSLLWQQWLTASVCKQRACRNALISVSHDHNKFLLMCRLLVVTENKYLKCNNIITLSMSSKGNDWQCCKNPLWEVAISTSLSCSINFVWPFFLSFQLWHFPTPLKHQWNSSITWRLPISTLLSMHSTITKLSQRSLQPGWMRS